MGVQQFGRHVTAALRVRMVELHFALDGLRLGAMRRRVLPCFGVVGHRNLGDELLTHLVQATFPEKHPIFICSSTPVSRMLLRQCIASGTGLLVGGGTLLLSEGLRRILEPVVSAGLPFATFGSGAHDLDFFPMADDERRAWVEILQQSRALGVRGPMTQRILAQLGVSSEVVGDPAVLYTNPDYRSPVAARIGGVNFGTALGAVWGGNEEATLLAVSDSLRRLRSHGWKIRFFCVWPKDLPVIQRLAVHAGIVNPEIVVEYKDPHRFIREVAQCRVFIGMKLHAVILAICGGVASLALDYQPKHMDYMASIQSESELRRIDQCDGAMLADAVNEIDEHAAQISRRQWQASKDLSKRFIEYLDRLKTVLNWDSSGEP